MSPEAAADLPWGSVVDEAWRAAIDPGRADGRLVAESAEREQEAVEVPLPGQLHPDLRAALERSRDQRRSTPTSSRRCGRARPENVIVTSGTASGKSLAFNMPVLDAIARDPKARALYLYPTKALAQDQARKLAEIAPGGLRPAIYDGDTPREERPAIRRSSNLILTNPDMLHVGVLPNHRNWGDVLANLRYVVVDEAHVYRGVFGSHVANVLRRLRRIARRYGSDPRFILTSATIANPLELAERLVGTPFHAVDTDAAPRAGRRIAIWNPPLTDRAAGARRSALAEAADMLSDLTIAGTRTICFVGSRRGAELIHKFTRDQLVERDRRDLAEAIAPYRAGYTPQQRREIEARLAGGELRAVVATNALELGIDIGELDAAICVGFPGHRREPAADVGAGGPPPRRARRLPGRDRRARPVLLPASDRVPDPPGRGGDPRPPQRADPVGAPAGRRVRGAARGAPATTRSSARAGASAPTRSSPTATCAAAGPGCSASRAPAIRPAGSACARRPPTRSRSSTPRAASCSARSRPSAPSRPSIPAPSTSTSAAPTRSASSTSISGGRSSSRSAATGTRSRGEETEVYIERIEAKRETLGVELHFGTVSVSEQVIAFQRKRIGDGHGDEAFDFVALDLPEQSYATQALWYVLPDELAGPEALPPDVQLGALHASEHTQIAVLPLLAMCDRWDIGGLSTNVHMQTGRPTIFIYDGHPGGVGISRRGYDEFARLVGDAARLVGECPCAEGCPSCVQSPKCGNLNDHLHKGGAIELMTRMLATGEAGRA